MGKTAIQKAELLLTYDNSPENVKKVNKAEKQA
jgi:hypothetical protein